MTILQWLKEFFDIPEVKEKTTAAAKEVKNIVVEGAEEVATQTKAKVSKIKRKRSRNKKGRFVPDDPTTKKNEAYEDKE